ncbi:uncharacterized protein ACBR49_005153 [Aulostomus maculatus]
MKWTEAQHYCREKHTDLATFDSLEEWNTLARLPSGIDWAWIGLSDDPNAWKTGLIKDTNSWKWASGPGSTREFRAWASMQPDNVGAKESCGLMGQNGLWYDMQCDSLWTFACYSGMDQNQKNFAYFSMWKTWREAQAYCREHYIDLPLIENWEENSRLRHIKKPLGRSWLALYREPWVWSDRSNSSFRNFMHLSPNNNGKNEHCVAENQSGEWDDRKCDSEIPSICYEVLKLQTMVKVKFQTEADMTDPATAHQIPQQVGAALERQGWIGVKVRWRILPRLCHSDVPDPAETEAEIAVMVLDEVSYRGWNMVLLQSFMDQFAGRLSRSCHGTTRSPFNTEL